MPENERFESDDRPITKGFIFTIPDESVLSKIDKAVQDLPVTECIAPPLPNCNQENVTFKGSRLKLIDYVRIMLQNDYKQNSLECNEWNGGFESDIDKSVNEQGVICINTRLFPGEEGGGSLCYISVVKRVSQNEYWLWDSHTDNEE